jgi:formylglycine-generating enzyme required for sulfatase activity
MSEDIFKGGGSFKSILLSQWKTSPCFRIACKTGWSGGGGGIANDVKWENGENSTIFRYRSNPDCAKFVWDYPVGRWFHFQQEILWTKDRSKGYYRLWMDGEVVFEANGVRTLSENFIPGKCDMFWAVGLYGTVNSLPEGQDTIGLYYDNIAIYDARDVEWMGAAIQFDEYRAGSEGTWQSIPSEAGSLGGSSPSKSTITVPATDTDGREDARSLALTTESLGPKQGETKSFNLGGGVELEFVWIPGGTFQMGSHSFEEDRDDDEGPVHTVELDGFWMGKTEVTQEQYERITGSNPSSFKGSRNPVETVSWNMATAFCEKLSQKTGNTFTLPTEAQWEYACRAGSSARYSFGDSDSTLGDYAWYSSNSGHQTHPVGQKQANKFGLYDMHGNVWEWCRDWYAEDYYSSIPRKNPENTAPGEDRVLRGGSRGYHKEFCRSAYRVWGSPSYTHSGFGFRVVFVSRTLK